MDILTGVSVGHTKRESVVVILKRGKVLVILKGESVGHTKRV